MAGNSSNTNASSNSQQQAAQRSALEFTLGFLRDKKVNVSAELEKELWEKAQEASKSGGLPSSSNWPASNQFERDITKEKKAKENRIKESRKVKEQKKSEMIDVGLADLPEEEVEEYAQLKQAVSQVAGNAAYETDKKKRKENEGKVKETEKRAVKVAKVALTEDQQRRVNIPLVLSLVCGNGGFDFNNRIRVLLKAFRDLPTAPESNQATPPAASILTSRPEEYFKKTRLVLDDLVKTSSHYSSLSLLYGMGSTAQAIGYRATVEDGPRGEDDWETKSSKKALSLLYASNTFVMLLCLIAPGPVGWNLLKFKSLNQKEMNFLVQFFGGVEMDSDQDGLSLSIVFKYWRGTVNGVSGFLQQILNPQPDIHNINSQYVAVEGEDEDEDFLIALSVKGKMIAVPSLAMASGTKGTNMIKNQRKQYLRAQFESENGLLSDNVIADDLSPSDEAVPALYGTSINLVTTGVSVKVGTGRLDAEEIQEFEEFMTLWKQPTKSINSALKRLNYWLSEKAIPSFKMVENTLDSEDWDWETAVDGVLEAVEKFCKSGAKKNQNTGEKGKGKEVERSGGGGGSNAGSSSKR